MTRRQKIRYELVRGSCFCHPSSHKSFLASVLAAPGVITSGSMRTRENLSLLQAAASATTAAAAAAAAVTVSVAHSATDAVSVLHLHSRGKCNKQNRRSC